MGDAALHAGRCTVDDLQAELELVQGLHGINHACAAVVLMNGLAESVLESRSRIEMLDLGLPIPMLQRWFYDAYGQVIARVDFYWPQYGLIGEADGDVKYEDNPRAAKLEKARTDRLHEINLRVVRWGRRHVNNPELLEARVLNMMKIAQVAS